MIHTAEEIITSHNITRNDPESDFDWLVNLIKQVQIEAIKECAEIARCKPMVIQDDFELAPPSTYYSEVDKESILKLIDQIK